MHWFWTIGNAFALKFHQRSIHHLQFLSNSHVTTFWAPRRPPTYAIINTKTYVELSHRASFRSHSEADPDGRGAKWELWPKPKLDQTRDWRDSSPFGWGTGPQLSRNWRSGTSSSLDQRGTTTTTTTLTILGEGSPSNRGKMLFIVEILTWQVLVGPLVGLS